MSFVICCPCGNPLDCENLDLVVSLACPNCRRDLLLEFDDGQTHRCRAMLTVMEGPFWVGERFLVPVGEDLTVGRALGNWLSLDAGEVAETHCRVKLTAQGNFVLRDANGSAGEPDSLDGSGSHRSVHGDSLAQATAPSPTTNGLAGGVYVDDQQVTRARIDPGQSFRIGPFRIRLDYFASDNVPVAVGRRKAVAVIGHLPTMTRVTRTQTPAYWIVQHRFQIARWLMIVFAFLTGIFHYCNLRVERGWPGSIAFVLSVGMLATFTELGRRVSLARSRISWALLGGIGVLTVLDAIWMPTGVWLSTLGAGLSLGLLTLLHAGEILAIIAAACAAASGITMTIMTILMIVRSLSAYLGR